MKGHPIAAAVLAYLAVSAAETAIVYAMAATSRREDGTMEAVTPSVPLGVVMILAPIAGAIYAYKLAK